MEPLEPVEPVPCVDLAGEYAEIGAEIEEAVLGVLRSGRYILGPECEAFERELAERVGVGFARGAASGTDALVLALRALGVGSGAEVVTTPFTFYATVEAIRTTGARPVFADVEPGGFNLDPAKLDGLVTPRTRAVLPVHVFGRCADMAGIEAVASAHGLPVIEDAAQALGASRGGRAAGAAGAAAAFSFYPSKNLSAAGDGGAVTTDDPEVAERVERLGNHGSRERDVHTLPDGTTSRLDALQAAVLRVKLRHLDAWNEARAAVAAGYAERLAGLAGLRLPGCGPDERPAWHQYAVRCDPALRDAVCKALDEARVEWRHFYPTPAYRQPALGSDRLAEGTCPEAERACREVICLPIHPRLQPAELDRVADAIRRGARG
jgi:dTDP-4-amino-4,6-dideoxygalactose transaminase